MTSELIQTGGSEEVTDTCAMQLVTEKINNEDMKLGRFLTTALQIKVNITVRYWSNWPDVKV